MVLKLIITFIILMTCAYLSIAFATWNLDITQWGMFSRILLLIAIPFNVGLAIKSQDD